MQTSCPYRSWLKSVMWTMWSLLRSAPANTMRTTRSTLEMGRMSRWRQSFVRVLQRMSAACHLSSKLESQTLIITSTPIALWPRCVVMIAKLTITLASAIWGIDCSGGMAALTFYPLLQKWTQKEVRSSSRRREVVSRQWCQLSWSLARIFSPLECLSLKATAR